MAFKSKEQKRREAIERKMVHLNEKRIAWLNVAFGTSTFTENENKFGREWAERVESEAKATYLKLCEECGLDRYGNELKRG